MDPVFQKAIRAHEARIVCFGLTLRPLTVGHLFVLAELGNAFPDHAEEAEFPDVLTAVMVCAQRSPAGARRVLNSRLRSVWGAIWGLMNRHRLRESELATFSRYLREQLGTPQQDAIGGGEELRSPLCWRLAAMLMSDFHMSYKDALKTPVALALTLWAVEADRRGSGKLASERQIQFRAWVAEQEEKRLRLEELEWESANMKGGA